MINCQDQRPAPHLKMRWRHSRPAGLDRRVGLFPFYLRWLRPRSWLGLGLVGIMLAMLIFPGRAQGRLPLDVQIMRDEFQSAGGLKFYAKTEELLRLASFEEALMRYRFLKGQIAGISAYRPLVTDIDRRLRFLQKQMHLTNADISPLARLKLSSRRRPRREVQQSKSEILRSPPKAQPPAPPKPKEKVVKVPPAGEEKLPTGVTPTVPGAGPELSKPKATSPPPASDAPKTGKATPVPDQEAEDNQKAKKPARPKKSFMGWLKSFVPGM